MTTAIALSEVRPKPGVLFGITHNPDETLIIRQQKLLKVGIGLPRGPALSVYTQRDPATGNIKWKVTRGWTDEEGPAKKVTLSCDTREAAEELFRKHYATAPICKFPRKVGYFTFTRPTVIDGKSMHVPDFDAIELHGPTPTSIGVILSSDEPFHGSFAMWSAAGLLCKGDGINAMRHVSLVAVPAHAELAQAAQERGWRDYPIVAGCATCGCPYARPTKDTKGNEVPAPCKPSGDLTFQLEKCLRIGGTTHYHTSGIRSIQNLFASLHAIAVLTGGRLVGLPLKMTLQAYVTNHNGRAATQYGVSLELDAANSEILRQKLAMNVFAVQELPAAPVQLIEAGEILTPIIEDDLDDQSEGFISPAAMVAEFGGLEDIPPVPPPDPTTAQSRTQELAGKLRKEKDRPAPQPAPTEQPQPAVAKDGPATMDDVPF